MAQQLLFSPGPSVIDPLNTTSAEDRSTKPVRKRRPYRRHRWAEAPDLALKIAAHQVWTCELCRLHKVRWSRVGRRSWPLYTRLTFTRTGKLVKTIKMSKSPKPCAQIPLF